MRRLGRGPLSHALTYPKFPWTLSTYALYHGRVRGCVSAVYAHAQPFTTSSRSGESGQSSVTLRPYQEDSIKAVLDYLAQGGRRAGLSLATGSGKTVIFSHLIDRVPVPKPGATQTLILAHRRELVEQAAAHCRKLYPDKDVDVEMGKQRASGLADITVASEASIMSGDRIMRYDPQRFKLVIVDEAHHIVAARYMEILRHFGLNRDRSNSHTALVGVSATLSRLDGLSLAAALDHVVFHKDYIDMIDEDWLARLVFTTVQTGVDLSKVKSSLGDFMAGALSKAVNNPEANAITVRAWLARAQGRKSTLVFCVDTTHAADLTSAFRQHGVDARFITGDTPTKVRSERLQAFKAGEFPVLLNVSVFTEGTDIPNIDCVLLARPTKSRNLLIQMIGRGLRKHPGKYNCHVIDMVSSLKTGIVTSPTLFGLDADELLTETDAAQMKSLQDCKQEERLREEKVSSVLSLSADPSSCLMGNITFTDYDDVNDLIEDTSGERHIRAMSSHAWVKIDEDRYILSTSSGDFLTLRRAELSDVQSTIAKARTISAGADSDVRSPDSAPLFETSTSQGDTFLAGSAMPEETIQYLVIYNQKITNPVPGKSRSPYMRPRQVATATTFESGVRAADGFAKEKFPLISISKNARWRKDPATDWQVQYLNRFRDHGDKLEEGDITKGKAGDFITKLKHGAKGRFNKYAIAKRKATETARKQEQFQERQENSKVKVGPLRTAIFSANAVS